MWHTPDLAWRVQPAACQVVENQGFKKSPPARPFALRAGEDYVYRLFTKGRFYLLQRFVEQLSINTQTWIARILNV